MRHKLFLLFLLAGIAFGLTAVTNFAEGFETWPPAGWIIDGVYQISATAGAGGVPATDPYEGMYCAGLSSAAGNYMISPLLEDPQEFIFQHKKDTGNHHFLIEYQLEDATPGPDLAGPWTLLIDMASDQGWQPTPTSLNLLGMGDLYMRIRPTPPPPSPLKYFYFDAFWYNPDWVPVELSSFTAVLTQQVEQTYFVELHWTTQSETGAAGFNVFRNNANSIDTAVQLNLGLIEAANTSQETSYSFTDHDAAEGVWYYWLQNVDLGGYSEFFGPISINISNGALNPSLPVAFTLDELGPNPFNPAAAVYNGSYGLSREENVNVVIYNAKGQKIRTLINGKREAGYHKEISWDGRDDNGKPVKSGVYYLTMSTDNYSASKKISVLK